MAIREKYVQASVATILDTILRPPDDEEAAHHFKCTTEDFMEIEKMLMEDGEFERFPRASVYNEENRNAWPRSFMVLELVYTTMEEILGMQKDFICWRGTGMRLFEGCLAGNRKEMETAFCTPESRWFSNICVESGYSQSYDDLVQDVTLLLEGSRGHIGIVILVKLKPLVGEEEAIQNGFVEV
ncbi:hypothetical protein TSTA_049130 [Talaromyces stipitatus ATCC 10500]|uniref:Uncharacterized protein n=1 Tax=Talaromyces stipitatus (strain ATCC 10500 / CBS 375.48 / QM 6759 / NRRL 1006) TaxID=441959 RepID=B8ML57_TALSN|nr:uncharacterized protein TSTA_049130 [Talaromyces stipitatus ATCC 10500]EED15473.1 hypothetical protein TSTA_049130 [Talaromyces stipitatus ATCC 10500]